MINYFYKTWFDFFGVSRRGRGCVFLLLFFLVYGISFFFFIRGMYVISGYIRMCTYVYILRIGYYIYDYRYLRK